MERDKKPLTLTNTQHRAGTLNNLAVRLMIVKLRLKSPTGPVLSQFIEIIKIKSDPWRKSNPGFPLKPKRKYATSPGRTAFGLKWNITPAEPRACLIYYFVLIYLILCGIVNSQKSSINLSIIKSQSVLDQRGGYGQSHSEEVIKSKSIIINF